VLLIARTVHEGVQLAFYIGFPHQGVHTKVATEVTREGFQLAFDRERTLLALLGS